MAQRKSSSSSVKKSNVDEEGVPSPTLDPDEYLARLQTDLTHAIATQRKLLADNPVPVVMHDPDGLMQCYHSAVVQGKHEHVPDLADETAELCVAAKLLANLRLEVKQMSGLISSVQMDVQKLDDEYAEQVNEIETLREIMEKRKTVGDMAPKAPLQAKLKKAKQLFSLYRTAVDEVITECFGDQEDNIKDLLQDLCSSYFEGSNLYSSLRQGSEIIGMLEDANVLRRHPNDPTLFRLNSEY